MPKEWPHFSKKEIRSWRGKSYQDIAFNVLSRREETTVFVPVQPVADPGGAFVAARVARVRALAQRAGRG